jgi:GNAT superfamily N-acetyltransferase
MTTLGDLWADYMHETYRRHTGTVHDETGCLGLITWEPQPDGIWIADVYVRPDARKRGIGRELLWIVEDFAREAGVSRLYGTVSVKTAGWEASVAAQEACGFRLDRISDTGEGLLIKELSASPNPDLPRDPRHSTTEES